MEDEEFEKITSEILRDLKPVEPIEILTVIIAQFNVTVRLLARSSYKNSSFKTQKEFETKFREIIADIIKNDDLDEKFLKALAMK